MAQINLSNLRNSAEAPLFAVFLIHFLFSAWSHLGFWSGNKLVFQDVFFLLSVMWATHAIRSPSPVVIALGINLTSILLDVIALSVSFPKNDSTEEFSAVMAIFNLILRLGSSFLLYKSLESRDDFDIVVPTNDSAPDNGRSGSRMEGSVNNNGFYGISGNPSSKQPPLPPIPGSYIQHQ